MRTVLTLILLALSLGAFAQQPQPGDPRVPRAAGLAKYVLVLWAPGTPVPADGVKASIDVAPPDIEALGGKVVAQNDNRRIVLLPPAAAKELRQHAAVVYLQRLWDGESTEEWNESYPESEEPRSRVQSDGAPAEWGPRPYVYDGSGNIRQFGADQYKYDTAGRLISATVNSKTETFQYDEFGNLVQKGVSGSNPVVIPVDPSSNRMIGSEYDAAGNVLSRTGRESYTFDSLNMMTGVRDRVGPARRMLYDPNDEKIGTLIDSTLSRWTIRDLEGQVIREYKGEHAWDGSMYWYWEQDHFHGGGALVGGELQEWGYTGEYRYGGKRQYHLDHLGSVRMVTNNAGRSLSEHDYYPFGVSQTPTYQEQLNWGDPHVDTNRFAGHTRDFLGLLNVDNNDYLDYMHARYYDPNAGRFLSVDPVWVSADLSNPQSWNRYAYVRNNPINRIDPDGRADLETVKEISWALYATGAEYLTTYVLDAESTSASADLPKDPAERAAYIQAAMGSVAAYQVGTVDTLRAASTKGDKIDIHHAPQAHPGGQAIPNYDPAKAPGIALPDREHKAIPTQKGPYTGTARDLVAKDIRDLRNNTKAPNSALRKLVTLIKDSFPAAMKKLL